MTSPKGLSSTFRIFCAILIIVPGLTFFSYGQGNPQHQRVPLAQDWSTNHLVFSRPGNFAQATQTRPFVEWYRLQSDPRYQFSLIRRNAARLRSGGGANTGSNSNVGSNGSSLLNAADFSVKPSARNLKKPQGDWS